MPLHIVSNASLIYTNYTRRISRRFLCPPVFWLFCPLASQYCIDQLTGTLHVIHLSRYNRRSVPYGCLLYGLIIHQRRQMSIALLHKKVRLILCKLTRWIFLYIIVYNSCTMAMLLRGRTSPVAPFSGQDVILYVRSFYSVILFLYSFIIHCFNVASKLFPKIVTSTHFFWRPL